MCHDYRFISLIITRTVSVENTILVIEMIFEPVVSGQNIGGDLIEWWGGYAPPNHRLWGRAPHRFDSFKYLKPLKVKNWNCTNVYIQKIKYIFDISKLKIHKIVHNEYTMYATAYKTHYRNTREIKFISNKKYEK